MSVENIPSFKTSHGLTIETKPFIMASKALCVACSHFLWLTSLSQLSEATVLSLVKSHSQPGPLHLLFPRTRLCSPQLWTCTPTSFRSLLKCQLLRDVFWHPIQNICLPQAFLGGPVAKNLPPNAGSLSGQGTKTPHATGQLSRVPHLWSPCALEPASCVLLYFSLIYRLPIIVSITALTSYPKT